ncbi:STE/STE11 protein kinase [Phytophthora nicotianae P1569]|uniref:STE/STE11 protein kinase n=2 Tax=Phytophthora nicotianae P1569 TaxID=1317065 RepID=V9DRZ9_PHYNI|nr:STE/STE11 protein kinase [Phytophthora nicotianae P1569]
MKDAVSSCSGRGGLALDFPQDEYSLMFPPSPEHSPVGSCNSWASGVASPSPCAKSPLTASTSISSPEIKAKKWVRKEKIGQGAQGSIYRYVETNTGREVAVKVIWTRELPPPAVEAIKREVKTMKRLRHRHLVRYLQATEKKQSELRIYMEYAAGGSLSSRLSRSGALPLALVKRYSRQLCEALQYLHQNGIAHRDIKCANILLTAPKGGPDDGSCADVKLADFGTFKVVGCASLVGGLKGTPHWMAPEVIRQQNMEDDGNHERWFRADVWSLGCAVLEMITGQSPWQQFSNPLAAMYQIVSSDITPTIPADVSAETASFLMLCLQRNPEHRGTIAQLLAHPFVRAADTKTKAKSSKHRIKRLAEVQVDYVGPVCNQQGSHSLPSTPKMAVSRPGKDLVPEPEPHEDSSTQSHTESPRRHRVSNLSPRSPLYDEDKRTPGLQYVRENALNSPGTRSLANLRLPRTPRLMQLDPITRPTSPEITNQDSHTAASMMPSTPTNLSRGASAGSKRLPPMRDLKNGHETPSISPLRLRRIATAPTTATKLEATEDIFPDTIRLPPLSARPTRNRCSSARSNLTQQ